MIIALAALIAAPVLTACGDDRQANWSGEEMQSADADHAVRPPPPPAPGAAAPMYDDGGMSAERQAAQASPTAARDRMLIRSGQMTVRVEEVEPAVERLHDLASRLGGYVGDVSAHTGDEQRRQATVHLRVPADRFDDATAAVRELGTVESVNLSSRDVTEQHADLQARLTNARRLEERLLELLATRTGDLQQVLAAERELARVRTEIEMYDGRLRQLTDRVEMATLAVQVREPRPVVGGHPGQSVIGEAFRQAWRNFVWTIARIIAVSGALIPILLIGAAIVVPAAYWLRRRRARRRPGPQAAD